MKEIFFDVNVTWMKIFRNFFYILFYILRAYSFLSAQRSLERSVPVFQYLVIALLLKMLLTRAK